MKLKISSGVRQKLQVKHRVTEREIEQCFMNREGKYLIDTREDHQSDPQTLWFIAETNCGRLLKICFIPKTDCFIVRTAYSPNEAEIGIYKRHSL